MAIDLKSGGPNKVYKPADQRVDNYFANPSREELVQKEIQSQEIINREKQFAESVGEIIMSWEAPDFEVYEKSTRWYLIAGILDLAMAGYGLVSNSPIMSITFIMIGIVGYIQLTRPPFIRLFSLTTKGVLAGKELYPYENIASFWIFYDPPHTKVISLHTKAKFLPFVHIPIDNEDPAAMHETLVKYIPEIEQQQSMVDTLEKVLHI